MPRFVRSDKNCKFVFFFFLKNIVLIVALLV